MNRKDIYGDFKLKKPFGCDVFLKINSAHEGLILVLSSCLILFLIHLKLELLTQFPASIG